jgi:hypothetical protein
MGVIPSENATPARSEEIPLRKLQGHATEFFDSVFPASNDGKTVPARWRNNHGN